MEASHKTHRPHIIVGNDAEEEEDALLSLIYILLSTSATDHTLKSLICFSSA